MRLFTRLASAAATVVFVSSSAFAQEYVTTDMEIDINKPAAEVWGKVGEYCGISEWLGLECEITSGDGDMGSVRSLLGGRILEIMVAQTELSYSYTQPAIEGEFYNLYNGFMEARPLTDSTSKMLYTLTLDVSNLAYQAAKDADIERRRGVLTSALCAMKDLAEAD